MPSILQRWQFKSTWHIIAAIARKPASSAELSPSRHPKAHLQHPPIPLLAQSNTAAGAKSRSTSLHHRAQTPRHSKSRRSNSAWPQRHRQFRRRTSRGQATECPAATCEGYHHQRWQKDTEQQVHTVDCHRCLSTILSIQK